MTILEDIKAKAEKATPGPWYDDGYRIYGPQWEHDKDRRNKCDVLVDYKHLDQKEAWKNDNGKYIARMDPKTTLALVKVIELVNGLLYEHYDGVQHRITDIDDAADFFGDLYDALQELEKLSE